MGKHVPSAEERRTTSSFELPEFLMTRACSFVVANAGIHAAWIRISRASYGHDFGSGVWLLANENGGHCMLLHHFQIYRARTRQKRKALRMLALSGVVRPSHVELRYAIPFLNMEDQSSAFQGNPVTAVRPSRLLHKFFELVSRLRKIRAHSSKCDHPYAV